MNNWHTVFIATGIWRAVLTLPGGELPFSLEISEINSTTVVFIKNGEEKIEVNDIHTKGDSVFMRFPVFDSEIKAKVSANTMHGEWLNYSGKTRPSIPFHAELGKDYRFKKKSSSTIQLQEKWEVHFSPYTKDSSFAIGLFQQMGSKVTGTFLTTTGDYRFLEGCLDNDSLFLSCFDGAHAYLFKARIENSHKITGRFFSGNHWEEPWMAFVNEKAQLPDPYAVTFLKKDTTPFKFEALTTEGILYSYPNQKCFNKVVVIQIMGSWCPNCMDETSFLSDYYLKNREQDLAVIGLAFEQTNDFEKAANNVSRVVKRYKVAYDILIAGNRDSASEKLTILAKINGYPTTIFIDKKGVVRYIHTGFNGPATGNYYRKEQEEFIALLTKLLAE